MSLEHMRKLMIHDLRLYMTEYPHRIPDAECEADGSLSRETVERHAAGMVDLLILEVQAAGQCGRECCGGDDRDECLRCWAENRLKRPAIA